VGELEQIARDLDGMTQGSSVVGRRHGVDVLLSLTTRGDSSNTQPWTEVRADLPAKYPLELHVVHQDQGHERDVRDGMMVDITVGNAAFDAAFVIEAAPTDVVRQLLDTDTQQQLVNLFALGRHCKLETVREGERVLLALHVPEWLDTLALAMPAIELVTGLASRVRDAYTPREDAVRGGPFRAEPDGAAERADAAERTADVAHTLEVRRRRKERDRRFAIAFVVGLLAMITLIAVPLTRC
jgi:hypothetical protein